MASNIPELEIPQGLADLACKDSKSASIDDLDENQKRWLVIGIGMQRIVAPVLRETVAPALQHLYDTLVKSRHIDTQLYPNYIKKHPVTNTNELNYQAINNNKTIKGPRKNNSSYDYKVHDPVELSKLFLTTNMTLYTGFDESCDISALLGILEKIDVFGPAIRLAAEQTRISVRNLWASCNFQEWDETKYEDCFKMLKDLILSLKLLKNRETETTEKLDNLKTYGLHINDGTELDANIQELAAHVIDIASKSRDNFDDETTYNYITKLRDHGLPAEILRMDNNAVKLYKKALEDGKERDYNIRLMVVGSFGVGKTAFTNRLLCQDIDINEKNSTDGIDVHVGKCKVSLKTMDWAIDPGGTTNDNASTRLAKILGSKGKSDTDKSISQNLEADQALEKYTITVSQQEEIRRNKSGKDTVEAVCLNDGDTMNSPQDQDDLLVKDLEEIIEAGDTDEDGDYATVSVWDFGGQFVFYTTHQMFLSRRAIYILVINLSQHIDGLVTDDIPYFDCSGARSHKVEEFIDIWLNSIHGHSTENNEPPVLLLGTHADKLKPDQKEEQAEAIFDAIRNRFAGKDAGLHFTEEDFGLSNVTEDPKLRNLRKKIIEVAKSQSHWGKLKPAKWIRVEKELEHSRRSGVEIVSRTHIEELNSKLPVPISSDEELELFLRFQHDVANIMYFSLPELRDKIVLSPQFLVNALKCLITAESFVKKKPGVLESWLEFSQQGLLRPTLLDAVWKKDENTRFDENRDHILALMEHLNIVARPVKFAENEEAGNCTRTQDYFLVPCMLKESPPPSFFEYEAKFKSTPSLCLKLSNIAFPGAIFNRLLCACISRWPIAKNEKTYLLFCGCGQFEVDCQHRLTLSFSSNIIGLRIVRFCRIGDVDGSVCKKVYSEVKQILHSVGNGLLLKINYEECVACPLGRKDHFECIHAVEKVRASDEFPCHGHAGIVDTVRQCDLLKCWFDTEEVDQKLEPVENIKSQDVLPSQILDRRPTEREIGRVSKWIGKEFLPLALELGLTQASVDQIEMSNSSHQDRIIRMLMKWCKQSGANATFRELEAAMRLQGIDTKAAFRDIK